MSIHIIIYFHDSVDFRQKIADLSLMDAVAEQPTQTEQAPPVEKPRSHRFTSADARVMAARSAEARKQRRDAEACAPLAAASSGASSGEYVTERLAHARAEIARLQTLAKGLKEPLEIERMSRAIGQWSEQERILAGRPLPGSQRPGPPRQSKSRGPDFVD